MSSSYLLTQFHEKSKITLSSFIFFHTFLALNIICPFEDKPQKERFLMVLISVADPGFSPGGCANSQIAIIFQIFAKNCMKMKVFGPPGGGGPRVPGAPFRSANGYATETIVNSFVLTNPRTQIGKWKTDSREEIVNYLPSK